MGLHQGHRPVPGLNSRVPRRADGRGTHARFLSYFGRIHPAGTAFTSEDPRPRMPVPWPAVASMSGMKALAGGWTLTGVGALLGVGSSLALAAAGPDIIDPGRSCKYRFDEAHEFKAHVQH